MRLHMTWQYPVAFLALNGVISELHEQAHITTGRIVHGCYGPRDFNVWQTCAEGVQQLPFAAPLAGPLFSYAVMWLGVWLLLRGATLQSRSIGFSLIFAPTPFARILTSVMGGGDEKVFFSTLAGDALTPPTVRIFALAMVLVFCVPPIVIAWRAIEHRWRTWIIAGFCVLPLIVIMAYKFRLLNGMLHDGVLATPSVIGTQPLVLLVFGIMLVVTVALWRHLSGLFGQDRVPAAASSRERAAVS